MNTGNNICLIGYMGSGKSTVGRLAARRLGYAFADTDEMIERREARTISEIFEKEGEPYFRQLETELIRELASDEGFRDTVLSTGGGIVLSDENRMKLKSIGTVVYLRADADTLYERVKSDTGRPLLKTEDVRGRIRDMLELRTPLYEEAADVITDTGGLDREQAAAAVEEAVRGFRNRQLRAADSVKT